MYIYIYICTYVYILYIYMSYMYVCMLYVCRTHPHPYPHTHLARPKGFEPRRHTRLDLFFFCCCRIWASHSMRLTFLCTATRRRTRRIWTPLRC